MHLLFRRLIPFSVRNVSLSSLPWARRVGTICLLLAMVVRSPAHLWEKEPGFSVPALESIFTTDGVVSVSAFTEGRLFVYMSYDLVDGQLRLPRAFVMNPDGSVDPTIPVRGNVVLVYPDGRFLVAEPPHEGAPLALLRRRFADGAEDQSFTPTTCPISQFKSHLLPDGRVALFGGFAQIGDELSRGIAMLGSDGKIDPQFQSPFNGLSSTPAISSVALTADGMGLLIAGAGGFGGAGGADYLRRLHLDGTFDTAFDASSLSFAWSPSRLISRADGTLLVQVGSAVIKLFPSGQRDTSFEPALIGRLAALGPPAPGGGYFYHTYPDGTSTIETRRMTPDAVDDPSFPALSRPNHFGYGVVVASDGALFVGPMTLEQKGERRELTRILPNGTIDSNFRPRFARVATPDAVLRLRDGGMIVAGRFTYVNNQPLSGSPGLLQFDASGQWNSNFRPVFGVNSWVTRLVEMPDGRIVALGEFRNGDDPTRFTRCFLPNGAVDPDYVERTSQNSTRGLDAAGRVIEIVDNRLQRSLPNGAPDPAFDWSAFPFPAEGVIPLGNGSFMITVGTTWRHYFANGSFDPLFGTYGTNPVQILATLPDGSLLLRSTGSTWAITQLRLDRTPGFAYGGGFNSLEDLELAGMVLDLLRAMTTDGRTEVTLTSGTQVRRDGRVTLSGVEPHRTLRRTAISGPSFVAAPALRSVSSGAPSVPRNGTVHLHVLASGLFPMTLEWLLDGQVVATTSSSSPGVGGYSFTATSVTQSGSYSARVSNAFGSFESPARDIQVDPARTLVRILTVPPSQSVQLGASVSVPMEAEGDDPITYQWFRNGLPLTGQTEATLYLAAAQLTDSGPYYLSARNAHGQVISPQFSLVVSDRAYQSLVFPVLAAQPFTADPIELDAIATSGLSVEYSVLNGPGLIDGNLLYLLGPGTVAIRATQPGNGEFAPALPVGRTLVVSAGAEWWRMQRFSPEQFDDASVSGLLADPDGDGVPNLLEYALGLDPLRAEPEIGAGFELVDGSWTYFYGRPADRADLTYLVETSTDLVNWSSDNVAHHRESSLVGLEIWRATTPANGSAPRFFRLRVERP